jgi:hypothetical protein
VSYYFKETLKLSPATITSVSSITWPPPLPPPYCANRTHISPLPRTNRTHISPLPRTDRTHISHVYSLGRALPWTCKPIYGFVSDAFPLFGYRRKPYMFLAGFFGSAPPLKARNLFLEAPHAGSLHSHRAPPPFPLLLFLLPRVLREPELLIECCIS